MSAAREPVTWKRFTVAVPYLWLLVFFLLMLKRRKERPKAPRSPRPVRIRPRREEPSFRREYDPIEPK